MSNKIINKKTQLRDYWVKVAPTIKGQNVMLIHSDSGITWGRFFIEDCVLSLNGEFELVLITNSTQTPRITVNEDNPWLLEVNS